MPTSNPIRTLITLLAAVSLAAIDSGAPAEEHAPSPPLIKPVRHDAPFQAYWITESKEATDVGYQRLLMTHGPIDALAGHTRWSPFPIDNMAMTFTTYKKDSLWDKPFTIIEKIGPVDGSARTVEIDGLLSKYEQCPLDDVIRLLENPLGTNPLHRRVDPLDSVEQTTHAFRLLLHEQLKSLNALSGPKPKSGLETSKLAARMEVDAHEHCFTVRFYLKSEGEMDTAVVSGHGDSGQVVVPRFCVAGMTITPPTYLPPPRRSMRPNTTPLPAGKEVLYGTYTMGYPPVERARDEKISGTILFREFAEPVHAEPQPLRIPARHASE